MTENRAQEFAKSVNWTRLLRRDPLHALRQLPDYIGIRPGKNLQRRVGPRQTFVIQVLARLQDDGQRLRDLEREHVLRIVRNARRVAAAPAQEDLVLVLLAPVGKDVAPGVE